MIQKPNLKFTTLDKIFMKDISPNSFFFLTENKPEKLDII